MIVGWTTEAETDLEGQILHIARDNLRAAIEQEGLVMEAVERLADFPRLGRPGRSPGTRELVVSGTPFVVVYDVEDGGVLILRLMHGAQLWPPAD